MPNRNPHPFSLCRKLCWGQIPSLLKASWQLAISPASCTGGACCAFGMHAAHPACTLGVAEEGAARGPGSVSIVRFHKRSGGGNKFPSIYFMCNLAVPFGGRSNNEGAPFQRRVFVSFQRIAEINGDIRRDISPVVHVRPQPSVNCMEVRLDLPRAFSFTVAFPYSFSGQAGY